MTTHGSPSDQFTTVEIAGRLWDRPRFRPGQQVHHAVRGFGEVRVIRRTQTSALVLFDGEETVRYVPLNELAPAQPEAGATR